VSEGAQTGEAVADPQTAGTQTGAAQQAGRATDEASRAQVWLALAIVYVVWGSTYLAIRVVVETMPPLLMSGARFLLAGAIVYLAVRIRRGPGVVRITRAELAGAALVGSLLVTGGNGLVMVAEQDVASHLAALIISSVPLWVVLYRRITGDAIPRATLASVFVGFAGVALLFIPGRGGNEGSLVGFLLLCIAAPSWALGTFLSRKVSLPRDPFASTAFQMMAGGVTSAIIGLAIGEVGDTHIGRFSGDSWLAFGYLVVFGSLIAYTSYVWLLQHAPVSRAATYAYVNPVIAIFLGWLILDEHVAGTTMIGAAVIVASVAITVRKETGG
jgi:drug/metabolite transporter (DMT)-like permease